MNNFLMKMERRFGKYTIPNLTLWLITGYIVGYAIQYINPNFLSYLALDPYMIIHKFQIWRLFSWLLVPPQDSNIIWVLLMLWCCYSIGTVLERTWGTFRYNLYIFGGIFLTIIFAFGCLLVMTLLVNGSGTEVTYDQLEELIYDVYPSVIGNVKAVNYWLRFSTYFINISIYLGFAMSYADQMVRFMFLIPVKMKWLGIFDLVYMGYLFYVSLISQDFYTCFAVAASLLNSLLFYLLVLRNAPSPAQAMRRARYRAQTERIVKPGISRHKCAVCDRTEETNPELEFRFCSKCNGNYEYCSDHLFTHTHVK